MIPFSLSARPPQEKCLCQKRPTTVSKETFILSARPPQEKCIGCKFWKVSALVYLLYKVTKIEDFSEFLRHGVWSEGARVHQGPQTFTTLPR